MYEERKKYELETYENVKKYVKNNMSEENKDRMYKIAIGPVGWEIKKETLSPQRYKELRDDFIAASLAEDAIIDNVTDITEEYVKSFEKTFWKFETANHFSKNAIKAMKESFPDQTANILAITGEAQLDINKMKYAGSKTYIYADMFILSFENSPASVEVRYLGY